mgnify:CR=1 FL=1
MNASRLCAPQSFGPTAGRSESICQESSFKIPQIRTESSFKIPQIRKFAASLERARIHAAVPPRSSASRTVSDAQRSA